MIVNTRPSEWTLVLRTGLPAHLGLTTRMMSKNVGNWEHGQF
jgi:hypothetical protein